MEKSKTYIATPPGYTIKEQLNERHMSQKEFALRMDMSEKHISKLINGEVMLTTDMSLRLELVLGIPATFWNKLEFIYREKLAKIELENNLDSDLKLVSNFPYNEMSKLGWLPKTNSKIDRVINLRKFFEVVKLTLLDSSNLNETYFRILKEKKNPKDYTLKCWIQKARLESRKIDTNAINIKKINESIPYYRSLTKENPDIFCDKLRDSLSSNGIAIVFLPHLSSSFLHGATFYEGKKIVLALTVREKYSDIFWFSFFHELSHILLGHINMPYNEKMEDEANKYAQNLLIKDSEYESYVKDEITSNLIISFSAKSGIDPSILVGRLQKDGYLNYNQFNYFKKKYSLD